MAPPFNFDRVEEASGGLVPPLPRRPPIGCARKVMPNVGGHTLRHGHGESGTRGVQGGGARAGQGAAWRAHLNRCERAVHPGQDGRGNRSCG